MSYTVHITVPAGPWPGGQSTAPWDDVVYDDPNAALEVARDAFDSRDRRRDVLVLDQDGETWDLFRALPAPMGDLPVTDDALALVRELIETGSTGGAVNEEAYARQIAASIVGAVLRGLTTQRTFAEVQGPLRRIADHYDPPSPEESS
jgi:hypothetical protein